MQAAGVKQGKCAARRNCKEWPRGQWERAGGVRLFERSVLGHGNRSWLIALMEAQRQGRRAGGGGGAARQALPSARCLASPLPAGGGHADMRGVYRRSRSRVVLVERSRQVVKSSVEEGVVLLERLPQQQQRQSAQQRRRHGHAASSQQQRAPPRQQGQQRRASSKEPTVVGGRKAK